MKKLNHLSEIGVIRITEVDKPYGFLHNKSPHPVEYRGMTFRTAETLFQWMRFEGLPDVQKKIKEAVSPAVVETIVRSQSKLLGRGRKSPDDSQLMKRVLYLKFTQHPDLAKKLLEIEPLNTPIILESAKSTIKSKNFWGAYRKKDEYGTQWIGENKLGILLMELNSFLQYQTIQRNKWINSAYA